jgi:hypothetical protein
MAKQQNILTPELAQKQDQIVQTVLGNKNLTGFQKAHVVSTAIVGLREMMTPEYMAPIMAMQGNRLGFKTDKDIVKNRQTGKYEKGPGYPMEVVRECVIEATLSGLQVTGNEFNIIGGNCYPTQVGMRSKLRQIDGLTFNVKTGVPRVDSANNEALFPAVKVKWNYNGKDHEEEIEVPLKIDSYTSVDAMMGKAKRKAYAWLYETVTGEPISDGDVDDIPGTVEGTASIVSSEPAELPAFTSENFEKAKKANATIEKIKERYTITPEVEKEYLAYVGTTE